MDATRETEPPDREVEGSFVLGAVDRAMDGDPDAMGLLYQRYSTNVYGLVRSIVRDEHEAEDITQQVFLKLLTSLNTFRPARGSFEGWLLRIARNAALDHLRRRPPVPVAETFAQETPAPDTRSSSTESISAAIERLPVRQRQVVVLIRLGLSASETARAMELSEGAVYLLRHRARRRLCQELTALGIGPATTVRPRAVKA
jgi:RNA polymerase sigma-70 factor (ECF subfamily)